MTLADTSIWIDYFREELPELGGRLQRGEVVTHPFVVSELAYGNFSKREETLDLLELGQGSMQQWRRTWA